MFRQLLNRSRQRPIKISAVFTLGLALILLIPGTSDAAWQGANGMDGDPATHGENGSDGTDTFWQGTKPESASNLTIFGRSGRWGGNGGNGIDGSDADTVAQAGNGGRGGNGGSIIAVLEGVGKHLDHSYQAGSGSAGGVGGISVGLPDGQGANGGSGGNVFADLTASGNLRSLIMAGIGGTGIGQGQAGGVGGNAQAMLQASSQSTEPAVFQTVVTGLIGGEGGRGLAGANGGRGGDGIYLNGQRLQFNAANHRVELNVYGGLGGRSFGGHAGNGGFSRLFFPEFEMTNVGPNAVTTGVQFNSIGGQGGFARYWYQLVGNGGDGSNGEILQSDSQFRSLLSGPTIFRAVGGRGGDVSYGGSTAPPNSTKAGDGGHASINGTRLQVVGQKAGTGARFYYTASAGTAGNNPFGSGGKGGDAIINNLTIRFNQFDSISELTSLGGTGGDGWSAGGGGKAKIENTNYFGGSGNLDLLVLATGGAAGQHSNEFGQVGHGGDATVSLYFHGQGNADIIGNAMAGNARFGNGGVASTAISAATEGLSNVNVSASAQSQGFNSISRIGVTANTSALAVAASGNAASSATSAGGRAWQTTGSATSHAVAVSQTGNASATARSTTSTVTTLQGVNSDDGQSARSYARARGVSVNARATSIAYGQNGNPQARASIVGQSGVATAIAVGGSQVFQSESNVELAVSSDGMVQPILVDSRVTYRSSYTGGDPTATVRAGSFVNGDYSTLRGIEMSSLYSQFDFSDGNYDLLNTFELKTTDVGATYDTNLAFSANYGWNATSRDVYAFIYDVESIAGGLEELDLTIRSGATLLLDKTFSSGDEALMFLDDWSTLVEGSRIRMDLYSRSEAGQSFQLRLGFAGLDRIIPPSSFSAVPEPSASLLLSVLVATGVGFTRRRRRPNQSDGIL